MAKTIGKNKKQLSFSAEEIENGISKSHNHKNYNILDNLTDNNGNLEYKGNQIGTKIKLGNYKTNTQVGGVAKNTQITDDTNIAELIKNMLVTYVNPNLSIGYNDNNTTKELGTSFDLIVTLSATKGTNNIDRIELYQNDVLIETINSSSGQYTFSALGETSKISGKAYDTEGVVSNIPSRTYTFVSPFYWGVTGSTPTETLVKNLNKLVETKGNKTKSFTSNFENVTFAYPKGYGYLKSIINKNSYEVLDNFNKIELTINGVDYLVYYMENVNIENFTYTFKF